MSISTNHFKDKTGKFIHFNKSEMLYDFINQYRGGIGNICCDGHGCKLLDVFSTREVQKLRHEFLSTNYFSDDAYRDNKNTNDIECPVCLQEYVDKRTLSCKHEFCSDCVENIIKSNLANKCPLCRCVF